MVKKIVIPATKKLGKELLKDTSGRLRVCAYVRVSTDTEEQLQSFNTQIGRYKRIICEEHAKTWEFAGIYADTESGTTIERREQFQDMIDKCREGLIDLILVKQMPRLGNNTLDSLLINIGNVCVRCIYVFGECSLIKRVRARIIYALVLD